MTRNPPCTATAARAVVLTLAEIMSAMQAFNDGDANAGDTLAAIVTCIEAYQASTRSWPEAA